MGLIFKSITLSFGVFGRMIFPAIAIMVASTIVWSLLNSITAGYASYLSGPITAAFISLFGIRAALSLMGDHSRTEYEGLILYSVLYGVFLFVATGLALFLVDLTAALYANWQLDGAVSLRNFASAERSLQIAFALHAINAKVIVGTLVFTAVHTVMAVPLASAARASSNRTMSAGFFHGAGHSFIPLFCIFAVSFFLQFFFGMFTFIYATVPVFISILSIVLSQTLPDIDPDVMLKGIAASAGLLWLQSLVWSASAVALKKSDESLKPTRKSPQRPVVSATDMRALRKSRE